MTFQKQLGNREMGKLMLSQFWWFSCALCVSAICSASLSAGEDIKDHLVSGSRAALSDSDSRVQGLAIETLVELGIVDHLDQKRSAKLIQIGYFDCIEDWTVEDYENRNRAIKAISSLSDSPVSLLILLISNGDPKIRKYAYAGLIGLGTGAKSATPDLFDRLKKNDAEAFDVLLAVGAKKEEMVSVLQELIEQGQASPSVARKLWENQPDSKVAYKYFFDRLSETREATSKVLSGRNRIPLSKINILDETLVYLCSAHSILEFDTLPNSDVQRVRELITSPIPGVFAVQFDEYYPSSTVQFYFEIRPYLVSVTTDDETWNDLSRLFENTDGSPDALKLMLQQKSIDELVSHFIEIIQNEEKDQSISRPNAMRGLGLLGPQGARAVPALVSLLEDASYAELAAQTLGNVGGNAKAAIAKLRELANKSDTSYQKLQFSLALYKIKKQEKSTYYEAFEEWVIDLGKPHSLGERLGLPSDPTSHDIFGMEDNTDDWIRFIEAVKELQSASSEESKTDVISLLLKIQRHCPRNSLVAEAIFECDPTSESAAETFEAMLLRRLDQRLTPADLARLGISRTETVKIHEPEGMPSENEKLLGWVDPLLQFSQRGMLISNRHLSLSNKNLMLIADNLSDTFKTNLLDFGFEKMAGDSTSVRHALKTLAIVANASDQADKCLLKSLACCQTDTSNKSEYQFFSYLLTRGSPEAIQLVESLGRSNPAKGYSSEVADDLLLAYNEYWPRTEESSVVRRRLADQVCGILIDPNRKVSNIKSMEKWELRFTEAGFPIQSSSVREAIKLTGDRNLTLVQRISKNQHFRSLVLFVGLLILTIFVLCSADAHSRLTKWSPLGAWALSMASTLPLKETLNINSPLFLALVAGAVFICVPIGAVSPGAFKILARTAPFHWLAVPALSFGWIRRKLFEEYVKSVHKDLSVDREQAHHEQYVPLPAYAVGEMSEGDEPTFDSSNPALSICNSLTSKENRRSHVLIRAPGGRGKSALAREVVRLSLENFCNSPDAPLPVFWRKKEGSLETAIKHQFGRDRISDESLDWQIHSGDFFLVVDDLNSENMDREVLSDFLRSDLGSQIRLLITMRPEQHIAGSFCSDLLKSDRVLIVEPQGLSEETYQAFESKYCDSSNEPCGLTEDVKKACKSADGTYWPILVRLALLVSDQKATTLPQIYEGAFRMLLKADLNVASTLLNDASTLCLDTYWKEGYRSIAVDGLNEKQQQLVGMLLKAGLLVPEGDKSPIEGVPPSSVRFFHDSMQSFLLAKGLIKIDEWPLLRAAGHPKFANAQSNQFLTGGSELFQMCLQVFEPKERLIDTLRDSLLEWAEKHDVILSKRNVLDAVPSALANKIKLEKGVSAGALLTSAVQICSEADSRLNNLANTYSKLAPKIWDEQNKPIPNSENSAVQQCKILFLAANPNATTELDLDNEIREIRSKIRESEHRGMIDLVSRWAVQPDDLNLALQEVKPHVVHFSCHGSDQKELLLFDRKGDAKPVSSEAIIDLLRLLKGNIKLVVFNTCSSASYAKAIAETIDFAIGMEDEIDDEAAIKFAAALYQGIGFGRSIGMSFELGKNAIQLHGLPDDQSPELFCHPASDDGEPFLANLG